MSLAPLLLRSGLGILGTLAGAPVAPPWGAVAGGTLGSMAGGTAARALGWEPTPEDLPGQLRQLSGEALAGAGGEMLGMGVGKAISAVPALRERLTAGAIRGIAERERVPLRAGDITRGRGVQRFENIPTYFPLGAGPTTRFAHTQVEAASDAANRFAGTLGSATTMRQAGLRAKIELKAATEAWKEATERAYRGVEAAIGPEAVVPTKHIREALKDVLSRSAATPMSAPTGAAKLAQQLDPTGGIANLPPHIQQLLAVERIPYRQAREIMSQFSEWGGGSGAAPVATIRRGQHKFLAQAMGRDIDDFMATQPTAIKALKEAVDQDYRIGKEQFNHILFRAVTGKSDRVNPEKVIRNIFDDPETLLSFKQVASDDLYRKMTVAWFSDIINKSSTSKLGVSGTPSAFSPSQFNRLVEPYIRSGQLDVILEPHAAQRLKDIVSLFGRLQRAERITGASTEGLAGHMGFSQLRELLRFGPTMAGLAAGHQVGHPISGAAFTLGAPYAIGKITTNPRFIAWASRDLSPTWPQWAVKTAAHFLGQGVYEATRERQGRSPLSLPMAARRPLEPSQPTQERVSRQHPAYQRARAAGLSDEEISQRYGIQLTE